jgi:hypothetical protein
MIMKCKCTTSPMIQRRKKMYRMHRQRSVAQECPTAKANDNDWKIPGSVKSQFHIHKSQVRVININWWFDSMLRIGPCCRRVRTERQTSRRVMVLDHRRRLDRNKGVAESSVRDNLLDNLRFCVHRSRLVCSFGARCNIVFDRRDNHSRSFCSLEPSVNMDRPCNRLSFSKPSWRQTIATSVANPYTLLTNSQLATIRSS